ncbi:hypothetical protein FB567DRAFT_533761 [Paraphoma chrysanthemicola]|uniref:Uncharacterized protein n=1 Tax=Paraphoma chrysanthemicola TaxID=798071 RepID=A0A8K0QYX4_9PLEO|nr:hypothetical protein FB567DRAFT_533761 [Paraphoma chrysanthemicola]
MAYIGDAITILDYVRHIPNMAFMQYDHEHQVLTAKFRQARADFTVREALAGTLGADGSPAILLVLKVELKPANSKWKIRYADLNLSFGQQGGDGALQVVRIAPNERLEYQTGVSVYGRMADTTEIVAEERICNIARWRVVAEDAFAGPRGITSSNSLHVAVLLRYDRSKSDVWMRAFLSLGVARAGVSPTSTSSETQALGMMIRPTNQDLRNFDAMDLEQEVEAHYSRSANEAAMLPLSRSKFRLSVLRNILTGEFSSSKAQVYISLTARIIGQGLEGFGGAMLAFAALKPNINSEAARWAISVPAFVGLVVPAVCKVFPYLDPSTWSAGDDVLEKLDKHYPNVIGIPGAQSLTADIMAPTLLVENLGQTLLDVVGCLVGILWNMAAGNGLVQNGYVGLISCVVASASIALSFLCSWQCFRKVDGSILLTGVVNDETPVLRREARRLIQRFQYFIAAPILLGIICALASVLGAAYMFGRIGCAESLNNRTSERNDYIVGQVFPAAVNFVFIARYLAELPHLLLRFGEQETDALLVYQRSWRERNLRAVERSTQAPPKEESGEAEISKV